MAAAKRSAQPQWKSRSFDSQVVEQIAAHFGLLPETARLLVQRGLSELAEIERFLKPTLNQLIHPERLKGMQPAVQRIALAIEERQRIMIHGDYDADGVTSAALLYRFFRRLGIEPEVHIPNRLIDNHGINPNAVESALKLGIKLFITCDCGISSAAEIAALRGQGIDTIVTDHHLVPLTGPPPEAIVINPSQQDCGFGDTGMSGVGIAYYLTMGLRKHLREGGFFNAQRPEPNLREDLDLVTLGTVADQAPLKGQNRIFVKHGLEALAKTDKVGLRVLLNLCMPADRDLTVYDVAFMLAPKLNAAGRLGFAGDAFALLVEQDQVRAAVQARKLMNYNDERRHIEEQHFREALQQAEQLVTAAGPMPAGLVLYQPQWHLGVLGLVSQKVAQRLRRPVLMLAQQDGRLKGSGRGFAGLSLIAALESSSDLLLSFGGHANAAGVALLEGQLAAFRQRFAEHLAAAMSGSDDFDITLTDGPLLLESINERFLEELQTLEPFGEGNPEPLLILEDVMPHDVKRMGENRQHLRVRLRDAQGTSVAAVGFSMGDYARFAEQGWRVLVTPEYNFWQGKRSIQLRLREIMPLKAAAPSRSAD